MKIKKATVNNHKKCFEIETAKGVFYLPFAKIEANDPGLAPTVENPVKEVFVDPDMANEAITYSLESGAENSVHLDAFLDYNKDPEYLKRAIVYKMTVELEKIVEESGLGVREIARRMTTSPSQLYRLLDTSNYTKTVDQVLKVLAALGYEVEFTIQKKGEAA